MSKDVENGGSAPKRTKRGDDGGKASSGKSNGKMVSLLIYALVQPNGIWLMRKQKLGKKYGIMAAHVDDTLTKTATYDEEDDGFIFRRTRSTKAKTALDQARSIEVETHRPPPKRKTFLTPVTAEKDQREPIRRKSPREAKSETKGSSGRVPNEPKEHHVSQPYVRKQADQSHRTNDDSIAFVGETQAAAAAARDTTKIQIPFADTPVINRNKQLRQQHGQGHRRSSVGLRGRRASSLIDSGSAGTISRIADH